MQNTVCYLHKPKLQPLVSQKLSNWFPPNICSTCTPPLIPNKSCYQFMRHSLFKNCQIFFSSSHQKLIKILQKYCFSCFNFLQIWYTHRRPTYPVIWWNWFNKDICNFCQNLLSRLLNRALMLRFWNFYQPLVH